jgi:hypothetical protein
VFALNIAALAGTFVFPLFAIQAGLEIWLINACLFAASLVPAGRPQLDHAESPAVVDEPTPPEGDVRPPRRGRRARFAERRGRRRFAFESAVLPGARGI